MKDLILAVMVGFVKSVTDNGVLETGQNTAIVLPDSEVLKGMGKKKLRKFVEKLCAHLLHETKLDGWDEDGKACFEYSYGMKSYYGRLGYDDDKRLILEIDYYYNPS